MMPGIMHTNPPKLYHVVVVNTGLNRNGPGENSVQNNAASGVVALPTKAT